MPRIRLTSPVFVLGLCGLIATLAPSAEALRLAEWNILNYPTAQGSSREQYYRTVLAASQPDLLVVQEMVSQAGVTEFLNNVFEVIEPGAWSAAPFIDGPDTDSALFYRTSAVTYLGQTIRGTDLRNIAWYHLRVAGYSGVGAEFFVYSTHLKAGSTADDQARRLSEATTWRNWMNDNLPGAAFVACGDFNIESSSESSYQKLLEDEADNDGRVHDLINMPGDWYNNGLFATIHTQSTRSGSLPDGGASGGMDDRFDFMLSSAGFDDGEGLSYVPGTYVAYGQDGHHFNTSINASPPNFVVPQDVANALYYASDHLPVMADFQVPAKVVAPASLAFGDVIVGANAVQVLSVENGAAAPADELNYTLSATAGFTAPTGPFVAVVGNGPNDHDITMSTAASGDLSGTVEISSNDVDTPTFQVDVSGTVLDHAAPSLASGSVVTTGSADFGTHAPNSFFDQNVSVYNFGFGAHQALLDVSGADFAGDPRFSITGGFSPVSVGGTPATFAVHFDASGASDGIYTGTLTFHTQDHQGIPGATTLADLVVNLQAEVNTSAISVAGGPAITVTRLFPATPNPVRWPTVIRFDLATPGTVSVQVFDVRGRLLRSLVDGTATAGRYAVSWDGRDASGRKVGSGVYYVRMQTAGQIETQPAVVAR